MNLFRSEEDARAWDEFNSDMEWTLQPVQWWAETFSNAMFRSRGRPDFISWVTGEEGGAAMLELRGRLTP
ncbi:MAG: hypothetical protein ACKVHU_00125 [Acidimicrobiales bacterium]|jgi:hypothetical protein